MPLPLIIGGAAIVAGLTGAVAGVKGAIKMKEAKERVDRAEERHRKNEKEMKDKEEETVAMLDDFGRSEFEIIASFKEFSALIAKIHNEPKFENKVEGIQLPIHSLREIEDCSILADAALGALTGAGLGAAGGMAMSGATSALVMMLGTASTGTAIAGLSGAAATNAVLAALGGGSIAAGGGGMALGTAILGGATLGVGLLVGGIIFNFTGDKAVEDSYKVVAQVEEAEKKVKEVLKYLGDLRETTTQYSKSLLFVRDVYRRYFNYMDMKVNMDGKTDYNTFTLEEKQNLDHLILLVQLLVYMCNVKLVEKSTNENTMDRVNYGDILEKQKAGIEVIRKIEG